MRRHDRRRCRLQYSSVRPGDTVAVVGCGGVGLNIVQGAAIACARRIVAIDVEPTKLDLAVQLGATETILASEGDAVEAVIALGGLVDFAFEAIGKPSTIELATGLVRPGGEAILVGMAPPDARVAFNPLDLTTGEKVIRGSWMAPAGRRSTSRSCSACTARGVCDSTCL